MLGSWICLADLAFREILLCFRASAGWGWSLERSAQLAIRELFLIFHGKLCRNMISPDKDEIWARVGEWGWGEMQCSAPGSTPVLEHG